MRDDDKEINTKKIKVIYCNARSLRNKIDELRIMAQDYNPDIIGIVETWLTDNIYDSEIIIENYNMIRR